MKIITPHLPFVSEARQPKLEPVLAKATKTPSWHREEDPQWRIIHHGASALSNSELLSLVGFKLDRARELQRAAVSEDPFVDAAGMNLVQVRNRFGCTDREACRIVAVAEIAKRFNDRYNPDRVLVTNSKTAYDIFAPHLRDLAHEECWILLTNNASRVITCRRLSSGSVDGTIVDVRDVIRQAVTHNASGVFLGHNHPSHSLSPSQADISLTRTIKAACELMNLRLLDHVIVAGNRYYSFKDAKNVLS